MNFTNGELNLLWSTLLIEELSRLPLSVIAIAPGSRSSALTVAVAQNQKVKSFVHFDERALGFYALGAAKSSSKPAVIITTSGTAVANLLPAITEASLDNIPLIVLSADRPAELYDSSANQTIDQVKIFGSAVRWFYDLPCPNQDLDPAMVLTTIDQAYVMAIQPGSKGPVQLNCRFAEPLLPEPTFSPREHLPSKLTNWHKHNLPYTQIITHALNHEQNDYQYCADLINQYHSGLVVIGKIDNQADKAQIITLIKKLNWPVFPDITSQLKTEELSEVIIDNYEALLASDSGMNNFNPKQILHIGGRLTSKRLQTFLKSLNINNYIKIQNTLNREDEFHQVSLRLINIGRTCEKLSELIHTASFELSNPSAAWTGEEFQENPSAVRASEEFNANPSAVRASEEFNANPSALRASPLIRGEYTELNISQAISQLIPIQHILFLGNSMPIRNFQLASSFKNDCPFILANRGASGIDGLLATACGCAEGANTPTTIVIGDLSALHDLNSLIIAAKSKVPIVVIIINNNGGAIFKNLPIADWTEVCTQFFVTPHNQNFKGVTEGFGLQYRAPDSLSSFEAEYKSALTRQTSTVIECCII